MILPSPTQVQAVLRFRPKTPHHHKIWAMCCVILDCGLRLDELLRLRKGHLNLDDLVVTVMGKGQKERVVPISLELRKILYRWGATHEFDLLFPTRRGTKQGHRNALRSLQAFGRRLGFSGGFHSLRHTFATNYIRRGGDVFRLQRILGHSTLEMTRRYVQLQTADLSAVHERFSLLGS